MKLIKRGIESDINGLKSVVTKCFCFRDVMQYYDLPENGKIYKYLRDIFKQHSISIAHWDKYKKNRDGRKHLIVEKECPQCHIKFTSASTGKNSKITCSRGCSANYFVSKRHSADIGQKISKGLQKYFSTRGHVIHKITCSLCKKEKVTKHPSQKYCSPECVKKCPVIREKYRQAHLNRIKAGYIYGWRSRDNPSYAEKFFMKVLINNHLPYEFEKREGKYYIDFAFTNKKIALEIDGKQHERIEYQLKDAKKDKFLIDNGWKVYRIPWNSVNTEKGQLLMKNKIDGFLKFYLTCNIKEH